MLFLHHFFKIKVLCSKGKEHENATAWYLQKCASEVCLRREYIVVLLAILLTSDSQIFIFVK
jgi:hypothetical protein